MMDSMIGKAILVLVWFPLTTVLLALNLALLTSSSSSGRIAANPSSYRNEDLRRVAAGAGSAEILGARVIAADARGLLLENFLTKYGSPMAPFAYKIVEEADANGLDFRLVPAIAMCESNLGKRLPSKNSFNAYGIAVYTGQIHGKTFANWEESISWVSSYIRTSYYEKGIKNLSQIGAIWAPPTEANGGAWSRCVSEFRDSII